MRKRILLTSLLALILVACTSMSSCGTLIYLGASMLMDNKADEEADDPFIGGTIIDFMPGDNDYEMTEAFNATVNGSTIFSKADWDELCNMSWENTIVFSEDNIPDFEYIYLSQIVNCVEDTFALQNEAYYAFNDMTEEFYNNTGITNLWVYHAYSTNGDHLGGYDCALSVDLAYDSSNGYGVMTSIYGNSDYDWIFENAHKYGFVRNFDTDGRESVFRYVGIAHAYNIYEMQQDPSLGYFYEINEYVSDLIINHTFDNIRYTVVEENGTSQEYGVYYVSKRSEEFFVPVNCDYTVTDTGGNGFVITFKVSKFLSGAVHDKSFITNDINNDMAYVDPKETKKFATVIY